MLNDIELLKCRYVKALGMMIDRADAKRRWIPALSIGEASSAFIKASSSAARDVGRAIVILELFADAENRVQHRLQVAYLTGKTQRVVRDCVLWAPDGSDRALIVPRNGRFHLAISERGVVQRLAGLPAADTTFGVALAARRLRESAEVAALEPGDMMLSHSALR